MFAHFELLANRSFFQAKTPILNMSEDEALLQLIQGNLADAKSMGTINSIDPSVDVFHKYLIASPAASSDPVENFESYMAEGRKTLNPAYRPRQANFRLSHQVIATVKSLGLFGKWAEKIKKLPTEFSTTLLDKPIGDSLAVSESLAACLKFTSEHGDTSGSMSKGKKVNPNDLRKPSEIFWVSKRPGSVSAPNIAAYWRDRLGLVHINATPASKIKDMLVRVEFAVTLSSVQLKPKIWLDQIAIEKTGVWLIRPTMVHEGNHRFVQAHTKDAARRWRTFGHTRDLASPSFADGEQELLVLYGLGANFRFKGVTLLPGIPSEDPFRDNSHAGFLSKIKSERGW